MPESAQEDQPGHVGQALGDHRGRGPAHRRADETPHEHGLQHLPDLARGDRHREPGEKDLEAGRPPKRDLETAQVEVPLREAEGPARDDGREDRRTESPAKAAQIASSVAGRLAAAATTSATAAPRATAISRLRKRRGDDTGPD